jgi:hypothetical protein
MTRISGSVAALESAVGLEVCCAATMPGAIAAATEVNLSSAQNTVQTADALTPPTPPTLIAPRMGDPSPRPGLRNSAMTHAFGHG